MLDLLVIGAGLTGLTAALRAAESGLKVKVIAKGLGSLHWSAATVDVMGYPAPSPVAAKNPWEGWQSLPAAHPYHRLGAKRIKADLDAFQAWTVALGLPYAANADPDRNTLLPSPVGAFRPVYLAPKAQFAGDVASRQPMLIAGFDGVRDFYPQLLADNLAAQGQPARSVLLPQITLTDRHDANTVHLAEALDDPARQTALGVALKSAVQPGERIGLPAILGLRAHTQVMEALTRITGATIFEIPTLTPSVPGVRLTAALRTRLDQVGVRVEAGMEAIGFNATGDAIEWVETSTSSRPIRHRARNFLLATGGVLGGGFSSDHTGRFWEVVFQLPLTTPQDRGQWFRPQFFDPAGQPVFSTGVAVNERWQPVDADGKIVYRNLWAAGGLLAGADPIQERSLEGLAISTAMAAVESLTTR
ncbi:MAG: glycerol-3-phosphate dehydrogenase subunit GlpB [Anaerolineales bacterium]|nr:glycerol-3-phosphate dehydrogenase subunit GlpB [Anaerolineales bacterium]